MKLFIVGGFVRDTLLGLESNDVDYVVVGSNRSEMLEKEFLPVGNDFEVFLHPKTKDEYALARLERNTGNKYTDFDCVYENVTLEDDLLRRDLTLNCIAQDIETGEYIDPYGGMEDIENKVLRHVSEAFTEDPIRLLRLARFHAKFGSEWTIAPETKTLCDSMYKSGMFEDLTPERVWSETEKALNTRKPSLYFELLKPYGIFPEIIDMELTEEQNAYHPEQNVWEHCKLVMDFAAKEYSNPEIVMAAFSHDLGKYICYQERGNGNGHEKVGLPFVENLYERIKAPKKYKELALLVCEHHQKVHSVMSRGINAWTRPKSIMKLFQQTNALVKPERL